MPMIRVESAYHPATASFRATFGTPVSPRVYRRVRGELCGMSDCTCGGAMSPRATCSDGGLAVVVDDRVGDAPAITVFSYGRE